MTMEKRTKQAYLAALREAIEISWDWAQDKSKLDRFMERAEATIRRGPGIHVILDKTSPSSVRAWRASGNKGYPTYKALAALPDGVNK